MLVKIKVRGGYKEMVPIVRVYDDGGAVQVTLHDPQGLPPCDETEVVLRHCPMASLNMIQADDSRIPARWVEGCIPEGQYEVRHVEGEKQKHLIGIIELLKEAKRKALAIVAKVAAPSYDGEDEADDDRNLYGGFH